MVMMMMTMIVMTLVGLKLFECCFWFLDVFLFFCLFLFLVLLCCFSFSDLFFLKFVLGAFFVLFISNLFF